MLQSALAAGICAFLAASLGCWAALIRRRSAGRPLVRPAPASEAPWGFADLLVVVVLLSMFESFALAHVRARFEVAPGSGMTDWDVETRAAFLGANSLAGLAAIFLSVGWLRLRYQLPLRELGIGSAVAEVDPELAADSPPLTSQGSKQERARSAAPLAALRTDVAIGSVAFFAVAPLVFGTQWLLSQFFESTHPLLELLKENPAPRFFAVSAFSAVLVAPLIEEFVFRVLLQGWIERFCGPERDPVRIVFGGRSGVVRDSADPGSGIGSPRQQYDVAPLNTAATEQATPNFLPIVISSVLFALMHLPHGSAPIPLFLFAVVLGYLYAATRRILPCIVTHALLNAVSLSGLWLAVHFDLQ